MPCFKSRIQEIFTKYVQIESGSDEKSETFPSTAAQRTFAEVVASDLKKAGLKNVNLDQNCYLTAEIPSTIDFKVPVVGFLAHMDTYPGGTLGRKVKPMLHKKYNGEDIKVSEEITISPKTSPSLKKCIGHDILSASGNTLLGADDKAGVAIIFAMAEYLIKNPQIKHGKIKIAFTPDEEIGRGPDRFDVKGFGADFAYTLDGECGEGVTDENFNAASMCITVKGVQAHPGFAKDIMQNPVRILADIISAWPEDQLPETTCGREGFLCFTEVHADFEKGTANIMVRDFDEQKLHERVALMRSIIDKKQAKYATAKIETEVNYTYKNMKPVIDKNPAIIKLAQEAFKQEGLKADGVPIRGGTDGARLSYMGLPTPNLDAGYSTPHGPFEWTSLDAMSKIANALIRIAENNTLKQK